MRCTPEELALADAAAEALRRSRRAWRHTVCAAVLDQNGGVWLGIDLVSRMSSVCAEPAAIAAAQLDGAAELVSIAAVCHTPDLEEVVVIAPCGACRERIWRHAPNARVLLPAHPQPVAVPIEDLFAHPDIFPHTGAPALGPPPGLRSPSESRLNRPPRRGRASPAIRRIKLGITAMLGFSVAAAAMRIAALATADRVPPLSIGIFATALAAGALGWWQILRLMRRL